MELINSMTAKNPCYTAGKKIGVKGLMLHSVGCPQPSAEVFIRQFNSPAAKVSVHAFVDANTGKVYQTLPWDYKAWHCGGTANSTHIGVEMCEPPCIKYTGGTNLSCSDEQRAKEMVMRTLQAAAELFAALCEQFGLNPLADGVIISHKEGHDRGVASGHGDPDHLFRQLHMDYTMDDFRKAVAAKMNKGTAQTAPAAQSSSAAPTTPASRIGEVRMGDVVSLTTDAVYYTGKAMPDWVLKDKWIVKSVSGDRVVIDENIGRTRAICSPVNIRHLRKE